MPSFDRRPPVAIRPSVAVLLFLAGLGPLAAAAPGAAATWRSVGPPIGTVYDVAIDPANPATVYALTWNGGCWRSDDGGASWTLPSSDLVSHNMRWLEIDPANPSTLWAGEDNPGEPALWRSKDRGASWKRVRDKAAGTSLPMHPVGYRIAFAPSRPADIWVPSTNLHYRSRDGGKSWSDFRVPGQDAYAMAVDPKSPDRVYAAGHGGEAFHFSRSEDGGKSWKATGTGLGAGIRSLVVDSVGALYAFGNGTEIWKSGDRGDHWSEIASPVSGTNDIYRLQLDPASPGTIWAATQAGLRKSTDGGASWNDSDRGFNRYLARAVAFDPRDPKRMFAAVSGTGVFRSADGGASWSAANGGFSASWIEGLEGSPRNGTLYARTGVGLYRRDPAGAWSEVQAPFADGEEAEPGLLFDRAAPHVIWAFDRSKLWRSGNDGGRWEEMKLKEVGMRDMLKGRTSQAEFASFAQDPGNPQVLYAGAWSSSQPGLAVSKSVDGGKSWKPAAAGLPAEEVDQLLTEAPNVVYALVGDGQLFRTDDGAASWKELGGFPSADLRRLVVDPSAPARLFAATKEGLFRSADSGATWAKLGGTIGEEDVEAVVVSADGTVYAGHFHGVSKSLDGGSTWSAVGDGLPNQDVRALAIFGSPPLLAAGTAGNGVFVTELP